MRPPAQVGGRYKGALPEPALGKYQHLDSSRTNETRNHETALGFRELLSLSVEQSGAGIHERSDYEATMLRQ
jgi:hypothetical protein